MNGFERFLADPRKAWEDRLNPSGPMRELWDALNTAEPNPGHHALVELEDMDVLRATITQNVDNLHRLAGSRRLLEIHGNATLIRCIQCVTRFERDEIDYAVLPPSCPLCKGLLKSDTVSFGEPIPPDILAACGEEAEHADCMLVAGTSATVYPAAGFPMAIAERGGDLIEVNPYPSDLSPLCRVTITGPAGEVLPALVERVRALRGY
jgi:NAD-dependent deacetylase